MFSILIAVLILLTTIVIFINNSLIAKKNYVEQAFSSIDVYLKKRNDLIPNLIAVVKKYTNHEAETLEKIARIRSDSEAQRANENIHPETEAQFKKLISNLNIQVENYPDLKADGQYLNLMYSFNEMEEQISAARRSFNGRVTNYNNAIEMFPNNIIAGMKAYKRKEVFEAKPTDRKEINAQNLFTQ